MRVEFIIHVFFFKRVSQSSISAKKKKIHFYMTYTFDPAWFVAAKHFNCAMTFAFWWLNQIPNDIKIALTSFAWVNSVRRLRSTPIEEKKNIIWLGIEIFVRFSVDCTWWSQAELYIDVIYVYTHILWTDSFASNRANITLCQCQNFLMNCHTHIHTTDKNILFGFCLPETEIFLLFISFSFSSWFVLVCHNRCGCVHILTFFYWFKDEKKKKNNRNDRMCSFCCWFRIRTLFYHSFNKLRWFSLTLATERKE